MVKHPHQTEKKEAKEQQQKKQQQKKQQQKQQQKKQQQKKQQKKQQEKRTKINPQQQNSNMKTPIIAISKYNCNELSNIIKQINAHITMQLSLHTPHTKKATTSEQKNTTSTKKTNNTPLTEFILPIMITHILNHNTTTYDINNQTTTICTTPQSNSKGKHTITIITNRNKLLNIYYNNPKNNKNNAITKHITPITSENLPNIADIIENTTRTSQYEIIWRHIKVHCVNKNLYIRKQHHQDKPLPHSHNDTTITPLNIMSINTTTLNSKKINSIITWCILNKINIINIQETQPFGNDNNDEATKKHHVYIRHELKKRDITNNIFFSTCNNRRGCMTIVIPHNPHPELTNLPEDACTTTAWGLALRANTTTIYNVYLNPAKELKTPLTNQLLRHINEEMLAPATTARCTVISGDFNLNWGTCYNNITKKIKTTTKIKTTQHNPQQINTFTNCNNNRAHKTTKGEIRSSCIDHSITCTPHDINCAFEVIENTNTIEDLDIQHRPIITSLYTPMSLSQQCSLNDMGLECVTHNKTHFSQQIPLQHDDLQHLRNNNKDIIAAYSSWQTRRRILRFGSQWNNSTQHDMWTKFMEEIGNSPHREDVNKITNHLYTCLHHTAHYIVNNHNKTSSKTTTPSKREMSGKNRTARINNNNNNSNTKTRTSHLLYTSLRYHDMIKRIKKKQSIMIVSGCTMEGMSRANAHRVVHCVLDVLQRELHTLATQQTINNYERIFQQSTRHFENGAPAEAERMIQNLSSNNSAMRLQQHRAPRLTIPPQSKNTPTDEHNKNNDDDNNKERTLTTTHTTTHQGAANRFMEHIKPLLSKPSCEDTLTIIDAIRNKTADLDALNLRVEAPHARSIVEKRRHISTHCIPPGDEDPRGNNLFSVDNCLESTINTWLYKLWHNNNKNHMPHPIKNVITTSHPSIPWRLPPQGPGTYGIDWLCDEGTPAYKKWGEELRRNNNELKAMHITRRQDSALITAAEEELKLLRAKCPWIPKKCFSNNKTNCTR
uniref:hypothetical protein n=1 Tax=Chryseobacterium sp. TaxID=1871047 RepID=UPI00321B9A06